MKILQLVSDWKWTGPAEPMLDGMGALRDAGHHVDLICPMPPAEANRSLWTEAASRGIEPIRAIEANRSALALGDGRRVHPLRRWLDSGASGGPYDFVHCWHSRDHVLTARALGLGRSRRPRIGHTRLVRFLSRSERIPAWPWNRWLFGPASDGLVCVSRAAARENRSIRGGRPIGVLPGLVDWKRLTVRESREAVRTRLGLPEGALLVGVVARMQAHRRFDLLLGALQRIVREGPAVHLVVIGRGTRATEVVTQPAQSLGLARNVTLAGYRTEDFADVLAAMDWLTYLVPGSDGSCRALLQAAALGLPLVGSSRGAIPEIIRDAETGILVREEAESIAAAWSRLAADPALRRRMGEAAQRDARLRFVADTYLEAIEDFHREIGQAPSS